MASIFCEASKDMCSTFRIFGEDIKGVTCCGDSKTFFMQQNNSGLVTITMV